MSDETATQVKPNKGSPIANALRNLGRTIGIWADSVDHATTKSQLTVHRAKAQAIIDKIDKQLAEL